MRGAQLRACRQGRPIAQRQNAHRRGGQRGNESRWPLSSHRAPWVYRRRNSSIPAAVRQVDLVRQRSAASIAGDPARQEPNGPDLASRRWDMDAGRPVGRCVPKSAYHWSKITSSVGSFSHAKLPISSLADVPTSRWPSNPAVRAAQVTICSAATPSSRSWLSRVSP